MTAGSGGPRLCRPGFQGPNSQTEGRRLKGEGHAAPAGGCRLRGPPQVLGVPRRTWYWLCPAGQRLICALAMLDDWYSATTVQQTARTRRAAGTTSSAPRAPTAAPLLLRPAHLRRHARSVASQLWVASAPATLLLGLALAIIRPMGAVVNWLDLPVWVRRCCVGGEIWRCWRTCAGGPYSARQRPACQRRRIGWKVPNDSAAGVAQCRPVPRRPGRKRADRSATTFAPRPRQRLDSRSPARDLARLELGSNRPCWPA